MSIITYLKDTQGELKHVSWPTRNQAIAFTVVVVLISVFVSFFLGFFDYIFIHHCEPHLFRHCEQSEAISSSLLDCFGVPRNDDIMCQF